MPATQYDAANWAITPAEPFATIFCSVPAGGGGYLGIYRITNMSQQDVVIDTEPGVTLRLKGGSSSIDVVSVKIMIRPSRPNESAHGTYALMCCSGCCPKESFPKPPSDPEPRQGASARG
jgi:hypothetical protein